MIQQLKKADDINEYTDLFDSLLDQINAQTADASDWQIIRCPEIIPD